MLSNKQLRLLRWFCPEHLLVLIGLATVIFQSLRAASKNPVESLKYD